MKGQYVREQLHGRRIKIGLIFDWLQPGTTPGEILSTARLARAVGVRRATVLNWGSGRSSPTPDQEKAIAKYLGIEPDLFRVYTEIAASHIDFSSALSESDPKSVKILKVFRQCALRMQELITPQLEAAAFDPSLRRRINDWTRPRKSEDPVSLDTWSDDAVFKTLLKENQDERLGLQAFISEESLPKALVEEREGSPRWICLVDPLDGSALAVRGLGGALNLVAYDSESETIAAALVIDFLAPLRMYYACAEVEGAYCELASGRQLPLIPASPGQETDPLARGLVLGHYHGSLERKIGGSPGGAMPESQEKIIQAFDSQYQKYRRKNPKVPMPRLVERGGSLGLCGVAAGAIDGYYEISKGFRPHDCWAGLFIAEKAKCHIGFHIVPERKQRVKVKMSTRSPVKFSLPGYRAERDKREALHHAFQVRWKFIAARDQGVFDLLLRRA